MNYDEDYWFEKLQQYQDDRIVLRSVNPTDNHTGSSEHPVYIEYIMYP